MSAASSCVSTADSASMARWARAGRSLKKGVAAGCAEAVLEAWAKRMGLAPMTLGDGYIGREERKERREAYRRGDPSEGKVSCRVATAGGRTACPPSPAHAPSRGAWRRTCG